MWNWSRKRDLLEGGVGMKLFSERRAEERKVKRRVGMVKLQGFCS